MKNFFKRIGAWLDANIPNWQVRFGALSVTIGYAIQDAAINHTLHKSTIFAIIAGAYTAWRLKDKSVTGGEVPQTPEAAARAEKLDPKAAQLAKNQSEVKNVAIHD